MNPQTLNAELALPPYEGLDDAQVLEALNALTSEYFVEPSTPELTNHLMNGGMYAKLLGAYRNPNVPLQLQVAAESGLDLAQSQIPNVNLQNANIQAMMNALVTSGIWTQADRDSVMNFARRTRSRAQELLGEGVVLTPGDIQRARNTPALEATRALEEQVNTAHGAVLAQIQAVRAALEAGEVASVLTRAALAQTFQEALS